MYAEAETNGVLFQGNDAILRTVGVMQPGIQVGGGSLNMAIYPCPRILYI